MGHEAKRKQAKSSSSTAADRTKNLPPLAAGELAYSHEQIRTLVPKVSGISISRETEFAHRWRIKYGQAKEMPKAASFRFGGEISEQSAIMSMLRCVWQIHHRETGELSPYLE